MNEKGETINYRQSEEYPIYSPIWKFRKESKEKKVIFTEALNFLNIFIQCDYKNWRKVRNDYNKSKTACQELLNQLLPVVKEW